MIIPYVMKKCSKCGRWLVANKVNFSKMKTGKYKLDNYCKECRHVCNHSNKQIECRDKYYKSEKRQQWQQQYYKEHREEKLQYNKQYTQENKEKILQYQQQYYQQIKNGTHTVTPGKTQQQFIKELYQVNPHIQVLETYKGANNKIKCKCKKDGYEWEARPHSLLRGRGCPKCGGTLKRTHEQFINDLAQINKDIEVLGTYVNSDTKIKCRCKIDGYKWEVVPKSLLSGHGCPKCNITKGEKRVAQYLDNIGINYIYDKYYFKDLVTANGRVMRPDFIIPTLKIWIEYDGQQHFEPVDFTSKMSEQEVQEQFKIVQQNDQIKNEYTQQHNWTLIRIPYWDYDNIEQILDAVIKQEEAI